MFDSPAAPAAPDVSTTEILDQTPALRAYATSLTRRKPDADDLFQETMLKALAKRGQFRPGSNLRAWMFTIMRNTFRTSAMKAGRERPGDADCVAGGVRTPATQHWSLMGRETMHAIHALPPHYRTVMVLVVVMGESYEDSARICKCKVGTVKSRVARGREMVIQQLDPDAR
ncbi:sigma-70 family RNA polymerase sigma factor [uncultured Albimonas sp.]|uniref:sigma-70 family RNA polymerase sigma factor n=1 Tax=uncultured Albimonas sp. TaxID=1331701 RepID=UPI0030EFA4A9